MWVLDVNYLVNTSFQILSMYVFVNKSFLFISEMKLSRQKKSGSDRIDKSGIKNLDTVKTLHTFELIRNNIFCSYFFAFIQNT